MQEKLAEAAGILAALKSGGAGFGIELGTGEVQTIPIRSIAYATMAIGRVQLALTDGRQLLARPSDTLDGVLSKLKQLGPFVRSHNGWAVNLDLVDSIRPMGVDQYELTLITGAKVPLLQSLQAVKDYFQLKRLDRVDPWNERMAVILREKLRDFAVDIRKMPTEELLRLFSDGTGQLIKVQLIGNIIWQAYNWLQSGRIAPFDGNLRSFWYSHIKPVLGRVLPKVADDDYGDMSGVFAKYVGEYHLFRYADFGFVDDSSLPPKIGSKHPHVIVFAEKRGHLRTLEKIQAETGATVISLGGQPSLMTTEYFVAELKKATPLDQTFHLISDVDYDPSGQIIAESFRDQLRQMGIKQTTLRHLIIPKHFQADEIKYFKYPVKNDSPSDRTKVKQWLNPDRRRYPDREPGGIVNEAGEREPMGLESDAMPKETLIKRAVWAVQVVTTPPGEPMPPEPPLADLFYPLA